MCEAAAEQPAGFPSPMETVPLRWLARSRNLGLQRNLCKTTAWNTSGLLAVYQYIVVYVWPVVKDVRHCQGMLHLPVFTWNLTPWTRKNGFKPHHVHPTPPPLEKKFLRTHVVAYEVFDCACSVWGNKFKKPWTSRPIISLELMLINSVLEIRLR